MWEKYLNLNTHTCALYDTFLRANIIANRAVPGSFIYRAVD